MRRQHFLPTRREVIGIVIVFASLSAMTGLALLEAAPVLLNPGPGAPIGLRIFCAEILILFAFLFSFMLYGLWISVQRLRKKEYAAT